MQEFIEASMSLDHKSTADLVVHNIGYENCRPGYSYGPRVCPYHIIHFVTKGSGTLHINQLDIPVTKGEAFLIPADRIASYQASAADPWGYSWIGFLGTAAEKYFYQLLSATEQKYVLKGLDTEKYHDLIRPAAHLTETGLQNYFLSNSVLLRILSELMADTGAGIRSSESLVLADEIRYYLEMKYSEKIKMTEIARTFGVHPNYMTRVFRSRFGVTPKHFLLTLKMDKACRLLKTTSLPVSMISDTLGFDDQLSFSKAFRRMYQVSPTGYRENV
ncbi:MAG: AraC family transcriptional regulator [Lachnospiraceae bacterium]|nr:AraC family transcriptional regulator [Lachnospiraceae bacterium]